MPAGSEFRDKIVSSGGIALDSWGEVQENRPDKVPVTGSGAGRHPISRQEKDQDKVPVTGSRAGRHPISRHNGEHSMAHSILAVGDSGR